MPNDEWDWPPRQHRMASTLEGRIERERVVIQKRRSSSTWPNRAADIFFAIVWTSTKVVFAIALTLLILACAWFIGALIKVA